MSAQDDDAAKAQEKPPDGEVDPSVGQHSARSEQHQPPSDITAAALVTQQTGNATPPAGRKRKLDEDLSKKRKKKRPKT